MLKTRQELFTLAWNGLKDQGFQPSLMASGDDCAYRGKDGRKCALGHCMTDEAYKPSMEGLGAYSPIIMSACGISDADSYFADCLQICHDTASGPEHMERSLRDFARGQGLSVPE